VSVPRYIFVRVSTELLAELAEWSKPYQIMVEQQEDGTFDLVFRDPVETE